MKNKFKRSIICAACALMLAMALSSCMENYATGERVGYITQFGNRGSLFPSYEGHLDQTQTGMNTARGFDFSIDNDNGDSALAETIDEALFWGWKVKLEYHEVAGLANLWNNRGATNCFVTSCTVLERGRFYDTAPNAHHLVPTDTGYIISQQYFDKP